MSISKPQLKVVRITMKAPDWKDFTGVTCGIEFENGEAVLAMDMDKSGRDMLALNNVCSTYIGTGYVVEGDYEEEVDDGSAPDKDSDEETPTSAEALTSPEGSEASESESDEDEGEGDEDATE